MYFFQFHIRDYTAKTRNLSLMEDLAYRRLLDLYYDTEEPISLDIDRVCRLIGMRDESDSVSYVLSEFFLKSEANYRNHRCDDEISKYQAKADRAKRANKARWDGKKSNTSLKSDVKSDVKSDTDQIPTIEPITNNQLKENNTKEKTPRRIFKPPSIEDLSTYCNARGNLVDPQHWLDFYTAKNWMIGKNKMKDWKAAVRTWEKRANETHKRPGNGNSKQIDHTDTSWVEQYNAEYGGG